MKMRILVEKGKSEAHKTLSTTESREIVTRIFQAVLIRGHQTVRLQRQSLLLDPMMLSILDKSSCDHVNMKS